MTKEDKKDIKDMIADALFDFWDNFLRPNVAMKSDLEKLATKDDLSAVRNDLQKVAADVKDIKRRVIDLETDTVSRNEFNQLKSRVN